MGAGQKEGQGKRGGRTKGEAGQKEGRTKGKLRRHSHQLNRRAGAGVGNAMVSPAASRAPQDRIGNAEDETSDRPAQRVLSGG